MTDDVASPQVVQGRAAEQKGPCTLKQDGVGCTRDHAFVERAGGAHRLVLLFATDMSGRADARGCREVRPQFLVREECRISAANFGTFASQDGSESAECSSEVFGRR
jgi:hypothetical protein